MRIHPILSDVPALPIVRQYIKALSLSPTDLHLFYEDLVRKLRDRGVVCAITSGLACVHYGVAETTKDCDLLCHSASFEQLLDLLNVTAIQGVGAAYRGNIRLNK